MMGIREQLFYAPEISLCPVSFKHIIRTKTIPTYKCIFLPQTLKSGYGPGFV